MARRKDKPQVHPHDLVLVKWLDAAGHREREDADPVPCLSVGWLVEVGEKDGKDFIKLASEICLEDDGGYSTQEHVSIPAGMIQSIIVIRRRPPAPFAGFQKRDE